VFFIPLAPGPLFVAVAAVALQLGQWFYKKQLFPNRDLTTFADVAACAAAVSIMVGYATTDLRKQGVPQGDTPRLED
jgi:hypothetical protein